MTSTSPAVPLPQHRAPASFVVVLTYRGSFKGMVGPFESDDDAAAWAGLSADVAAGWSWTIEPVVTPAALVEAEVRGAAVDGGHDGVRHLHVVR